MSATLTVTGTCGPADTLTAVVFTLVSRFSIDCVNNMLSFLDKDGRTVDISISAATTITATKSGSTYTLVIS